MELREVLSKYEMEIEKYIVERCDLERENVRWYSSKLFINKVDKYYAVTAYLSEYETELMEELDDLELDYRVPLDDIMIKVVKPLMLSDSRDEKLNKLLGEDL